MALKNTDYYAETLEGFPLEAPELATGGYSDFDIYVADRYIEENDFLVLLKIV